MVNMGLVQAHPNNYQVFNPSLYTIIGASLSEPHIDRDNGPRARNNGIYLCMYVSIYLSIYLSMSVSFTPRLSHPGSRDLYTP